MYTIIPIPDFERAKAFAPLCDWCICQAKFDYDTYTLNGETFYFCLKEGFEKTAKRAGENHPFDAYGLSMIAVSVTPDGRLANCTNRWNEDRIGNPNLTVQEISQMVGHDFYEVFKPIPFIAKDADVRGSRQRRCAQRLYGRTMKLVETQNFASLQRAVEISATSKKRSSIDKLRIFAT